MELIEIKNRIATIRLSKREFRMLRAATGGAHFKGTSNRNIPVLTDWTKEEAIKFEREIREASDNMWGNKELMRFSKKELFYLLRIHHDNMIELDPIEYPIITGIDFKDAEKLWEELQEIISDF